MEAAWGILDEAYDIGDIFGPHAVGTLLPMAARAAHHDLPVALSLMAGLVACTNGAQVQVFPGSVSPLMLCVVNVNYPQTRKSAAFPMLSKIGSMIDKGARLKAQAAERDALLEEEEDAGNPRAAAKVERKVAALKVITSTLTTFTEAAFFKRVSGDLDQVAGGKTTGRFTYGCMVNLDESYKFLRMLGLMHEKSGASRSTGDSGTVPDAASEFNRLLQTGTASMSTKTSGAFGEGDAPSVSLGIIGNAHPAVVVPIERGDLGVNHAAAKERLLFVTARPIEPHSGLSSRLELPGGVKRWVWLRLLKCAVEALGFPPGVDEPALAAERLSRARPANATRCDSDDEGEDDALFVPDASGYRVSLADGTESRLRFRKEQGKYVAEFRGPNRAVDLAAGHDEVSVATRVLDYFSDPHMTVPFSGAGRLTFQGLCTCFTVQCALSRDSGDVMGAARLGVGPWHLAMLSASLLVLEIGVGCCDHAPELVASKLLCIESHHVARAYELLGLLQRQRACWHDLAEAPGPDAARSAAAIAAAGGSQRQASILAQPPPHAHLYQEFAPTQGVQAADSARQAGASPEPCEAAPAGSQPLSPGVAPATPCGAAASSGGAPPAAGDPAQPEVEAILGPTDPGIPSMEIGYGQNGAQVQLPELGTVIMTDRHVMKATLLRGEATYTYRSDACQCRHAKYVRPQRQAREDSSWQTPWA